MSKCRYSFEIMPWSDYADYSAVYRRDLDTGVEDVLYVSSHKDCQALKSELDSLCAAVDGMEICEVAVSLRGLRPSFALNPLPVTQRLRELLF